MSKVRFEISMSLDGYVTASGVRAEEPMGDGGQRLHEWAFGADEVGRELLAESQGGVGASIAGRRTYDLSVPWWGADGPGGSARTPTFIVSHSEPEQVPEGGVYTFVDSPEEALERARAVAGDKDVDVFSANIGGQLLRAGLVDEIHVHLVPVLFGAGTRLFEDVGAGHIQLEATRVIERSTATHLRYRVLKAASIGFSV
jgi:dihydrofolate reductase